MNFLELKNNNSVYLLKFKKSVDEEFDREVSESLEELFSYLLDKGEENYIAFSEEEDGEILLLFLEERKVNIIIDFVKRYDILQYYKEISNDILMGRITNDNFNKVEGRVSFDKMLDSFITKNLSVDLVLDKINEFGIEKLNEKDYKILSNV